MKFMTESPYTHFIIQFSSDTLNVRFFRKEITSIKMIEDTVDFLMMMSFCLEG